MARHKVALALLHLIFCAHAPIAAAQTSGGTLRVSHFDNPPSASILEESTISTIMPYMAIFNNLVIFDQNKKRNDIESIRPELATEWSWSPDAKALTFKLRTGVKWHDGKPFTSADVKCTWDLLLETGNAKLRRNPRKAWFTNVTEVTASDPFVVTFQLTSPQQSLLAMLAGGHSPIYPCHVTPAQMRTHPIGTGPFKFVDFKQNQSIKLVRNENYWKRDLPYLDGIEYTIIKDRAASMLAFSSGQLDLTFPTTVTAPAMRDIARQAPSAICEMNLANSHLVVLTNHDRPPFNDQRIARAVGLAIDRKAFVDILYEGQALVGGVMMPPPFGGWGLQPRDLEALPGYAPDVEANRAQARKAMSEAGYNTDKRLRVKVAARNIAQYRDPAVLLIDHLKQVGIDAELEVFDTALWFNRLIRRDYTIAIDNPAAGIDDPDVVLNEMYSCGAQRNYTNYCSQKVQAMLAKQSAEQDQSKRHALVNEIDRQLLLDGTRPVVVHPKYGTCYQSTVKGLVLNTNSAYNNWRFDSVWLEKR